MLFEASMDCKLNVAFPVLHLIVTTMRFLSCGKHSDSHYGPTSLLSKTSWRWSSHGTKLSNWPPSRAEVRNTQSYTSTHFHGVVVKHTINFTLPFTP